MLKSGLSSLIMPEMASECVRAAPPIIADQTPTIRFALALSVMVPTSVSVVSPLAVASVQSAKVLTISSHLGARPPIFD
jgi:hypothetical protein